MWPVLVSYIEGDVRNFVLERSHPSALPVFRLLRSSVAFTFWKQREKPVGCTKQRSAQVTSRHSRVTSRVLFNARLREHEMHKCDLRCQRCMESGCNMWHVTYRWCFVMLLYFSGIKTRLKNRCDATFWFATSSCSLSFVTAITYLIFIQLTMHLQTIPNSPFKDRSKLVHLARSCFQFHPIVFAPLFVVIPWENHSLLF